MIAALAIAAATTAANNANRFSAQLSLDTQPVSGPSTLTAI